MDIVLNEKVDHGNQCSEETVAKQLSVLLGLGVLRGGLDGASNVRDGAEQVDNHGNVVDIVIIRRGNVDPSTTGNCPDNVVGQEELGKALGAVRGDIANSQQVPEVAQHQTRTYFFHEQKKKVQLAPLRFLGFYLKVQRFFFVLTRGQGDKDLADVAFRVPVSCSGADTGEPFLRWRAPGE